MRFLHSTIVQVCFGVVLLVAATLTYSNDDPARATSGTLDGYTTHAFTDSRGLTVTYYLHVPQNYNPAAQYPLVLILHGTGEHGQVTNTPAANRQRILKQPYVNVWTTASIQQEWPSFVVVPQLSGDARWVDVPPKSGSYTMAAEPSDGLLAAKEIVDQLQRKFTGIDATRLYVAGISMGGFGAWEAIERWPTYFAAAIPIAGAGDPSKATAIAQLPIWAFHGTKDTTTPVSGSRDMIKAIEAAGGHPCYTEYPDQGHTVWVTAFTIHAVFTWLFAQERS